MTWTIGGVNLPEDPYFVECKNNADTQGYRSSGDLPLIVSFGEKARLLTIEGFIYSPGRDKDYLETNWVIPYEGKVATEIVINCPGSRYDGTWLMAKFDYKEEAAGVLYFKYRMELWQGVEYVVL